MVGKLKQGMLAGRPFWHRNETDFRVLKAECHEEGIYRSETFALNDGDCVIDVGANLGGFLFQVASRVRHARVVCFEPIPDTFTILQRNAKSCPHLDIQLENVGLSDHSGLHDMAHFPLASVNSTMYLDSSHDKRRNDRNFVFEEMRLRSRGFRMISNWIPRIVWLPIIEFLRLYHGRTTKVTCQFERLSDWIVQSNLERIDLLKIDVEGAEAKVLDGIDAEHWPRIQQVVMETHSGEPDAIQLEDRLNQLGFETQRSLAIPCLDRVFMVYATRVPRDPESRQSNEAESLRPHLAKFQQLSGSDNR